MGNSLVMYLFIRSKRIRSNVAGKLIFLLSTTDWLFALLNLPHIIYLLAKWVPDKLFHYNPVFTVVSDLPLTVQIKINLILTLYIALDRLQAVRFPVYYRKKDGNLQKKVIFIGSIIWGLLDCVIELILTKIQNGFKPNDLCAAAGCFTSNDFKAYNGACNTLLGAIGVLLTLIFSSELLRMRSKNKALFNKTDDDKKFELTNRLSMGVLLNSTIFLMFPSATIGILSAFGIAIFRKLGPIYSFCLISAGFTNSIVYLTMHADLNSEARRLLHYKLNKIGPKSVQIHVLSHQVQST